MLWAYSFPTKADRARGGVLRRAAGTFHRPYPFRPLRQDLSTYRLESPPGPSFCYPYIGVRRSQPLSGRQLLLKQRVMLWVRHGAAVEQAANTRVHLVATRKTLAALEPRLPVGFVQDALDLRSPED